MARGLFFGDMRLAVPCAGSLSGVGVGTRETYQKTLVQACIVAGDETALAEKLGVAVNDLVDWLLGNHPMPNDYFLRAVDIVLASHVQHVEDVKAFLEAVRRRRSH